MDNYLKNDGKIALSQLELPEDLKKLSLRQCNFLCNEIRNMLVNTVSKTGGHLSSNLGVVELTLSIHRNFNSPDDKIIWDVGHQAYVHKILTGRADKLSTLRQENGISGFPKPDESVHDTFISGHSSTSLSVACGIAEAMRIQGKDNYTIAVIGDGAMTGGMVYEAMNNCCNNNKSNMIVILNDNNMSISKSVGSLEKHLTTLRNSEKYLDTKRKVEKNLTQIPVVGMKAAKGVKCVKDAIKSTILERNLFEDMGFIYLGPIDGHNLKELEQAMRMAKSFHKPVFIHVKTIKGKGYLPAEKNSGEYHSISRFDIITGNPEVSSKDSYSTVFGKELLNIAKKDERICAITAAMKYGTGLQYFGKEIPERFYDVGIAEQHAVTFAGGLAVMGQIPVFAVYSTFLQRSYDQLIHDIAIGGLHVVLGIDRAGIVGEDGETHQGMFDVPMLTSIPNTVIYSPSCYEELKLCMKKAIYNEKYLTAVRYPRGSEEVSFSKNLISSEYTFLKKGISNILVISYGRIFNEAYKAQSLLSADGINCDLLKLTKIYPVPEKLMDEIKKYNNIIFFEEAISNGSISEKFGCMLIELGYKGDYSHIAVKGFIKQATVNSSLDNSGLTFNKMADYIRIR
ncbi:MAG: 1-deoxy-D-xylulose-5-phosphate synthase, partial [Ruminococcus sp.]|nr:1-deoxy-D-xylulose-5-phosphate synthase [Ruminococcus sp.]